MNGSPHDVREFRYLRQEGFNSLYVVLGAKALDLFLEDGDLPGQRPAATDRGSPVVVRERDHPGQS